MKVMHIITGLNIGGAEKTLLRLLQKQRMGKNTSVVVSLCGIGGVGKELSKVGSVLYNLEISGFTSIIKAIVKLIRILRNESPDVVQTWMYHADLFGGVVAFIYGYRNIIWNVRRSTAPTSNKTLFIMRICGIISAIIPKRIVFVSVSGMINHIKFGYSEKKSLVIPNGFDFEEICAGRRDINYLKKKYGIPETDVIIGCVGRYHVDKGQDILLSAARVLIERYPIHILLVGRGCDGDNQEIGNLVMNSSLAGKVTLLGEVENVYETLLLVDIYCMPSRTEGFPNSLCEAMIAGLPCVATDVGDVERIAEHSVEIVRAESVDEMIASLEKYIMLGSDRRKKYGLKASSVVKNKYSVDIMAYKYETLYESVTMDVM